MFDIAHCPCYCAQMSITDVSVILIALSGQSSVELSSSLAKRAQLLLTELLETGAFPYTIMTNISTLTRQNNVSRILYVAIDNCTNL